MANPKKVLICPLDWGLGHATRCIPIIRSLLDRNTEIFIASSNEALELLKQEFPHLTFFELPPYQPVYQSTGFLSIAMLGQLAKFKKAISNEHIILERLVKDHSIDLVISDNRYGCWSVTAKSIFITHQVNLLMPKGFGWTSSFINYYLHSYIKRFNELWIPDQNGILTFPFASKNIAHQRYIGWLSRFKKSNSVEKIYEIIALVSGPEPQRTAFQKILTDQLIASGRKSLLLTGQPGKMLRLANGNLEIVNHLPAEDLSRAIQDSEIVVCRSGYSTIMDLIALGRPAIFVPTPQQPEQMFLADLLNERRIAFAVEQKDFDLEVALIEMNDYKGLSQFEYNDDDLQTAINTILK